MNVLSMLFVALAAMVVFAVLVVGWLFHVSRPYRTTDWGAPWLNRLDGLNRWFCVVYHRLNFTTIALPETGAGIVAANHHSGLDPLLLAAASPRPLRFLIAREQYERFGLRWLFRAAGCIPVDRETRPERALREALRILARGEVVAMFPHGKIHLDTDPPIKLKSGVIRLSHLSGCAIHPVRLQGIAGQGKVVSAVLLRGYPHLRVATTLQCDKANGRLCLEQLTAILEGRDLDPPAQELSRAG